MGEDATPRDGTDPLAAAKQALRAQARAFRALKGDVTRSHPGRAWTDHVLALDAVRDARVVAAYVSYGVEPPTADLVDALRARGVRVLLPVLLDDRDLDWVDADDAAAERLGTDAVAAADVVVVPALLVGRDGTRLGQGGGSYDRALRRVAARTPVVALLHDGELREAGVLPRADHDVAVTHVVTPHGALTVGTRPVG